MGARTEGTRATAACLSLTSLGLMPSRLQILSLLQSAIGANRRIPRSMHWMSMEEMRRYGVVNVVSDDTPAQPFGQAFVDEYESTCHNCPGR